jgi:hypothetical protein
VNERGDGAFSVKLRCKNASINSNSHYCYCYCICKTLQVSRGGEPKKLKGKKEEKLCAAKENLAREKNEKRNRRTPSTATTSKKHCRKQNQGKKKSKHVQMSSPSLTYLQSCKLRSTNSIAIISCSCCSAPLLLLL